MFFVPSIDYAYFDKQSSLKDALIKAFDENNFIRNKDNAEKYLKAFRDMMDARTAEWMATERSINAIFNKCVTGNWIEIDRLGLKHNQRRKI